MKRIIYLASIFFLLLAAVTPAAAGPAASGPQSPLNQTGDQEIFLPLAMNHRSFTVSGRIILDQANYVPDTGPASVTTDIPLGGVPVVDSLGRVAYTDSQGRYTISVRDGSTITPQVNDYYFYPTYTKIDAKNPNNNLNFVGSAPRLPSSVAMLRPEAQVLPNPSFETVPYYWNPISGNAAGWTPFYSSGAAHTGTRSGFTGISSGWSTYQESWSRWRSHEIYIPPGATVANVTLWMDPGTNEVVLASEENQVAHSEELAADFAKHNGLDTEAPNLPPLNTLDGYYVRVIRPDNTKIVDLITIDRTNAGWTQIGPLSLAAYAGQWIKLEFGTYNNTNTAASWAYFDDVTLDIDTAAVTCSQILLNNGFETATDWLMKTPQTNPPEYTTLDFFSPLQSMQIGVAPWETEFDVNTTSEFFQPFTLPAGTTYAQLRMLVRPRSTGWYGWWSTDGERNMQPVADIGEPYSTNAPTQTESQYAFIADSAGLDGQYMLFKYFSLDTGWLARAYNLTYIPRGVPYSVLFGVGDTDYRKTSMFVDEVYLDVCTP